MNLEYGSANRRGTGYGKKSSSGKRRGARLRMSLALFTAAVLIRAAFPAVSEKFGSKLLGMIDNSMDYRTAFAEVGKLFSGETSFGEAVSAIKNISEEADRPREEKNGFEPSGMAFHRLQSGYIECLDAAAAAECIAGVAEALPENVSVQRAEPPFSYVRPVCDAVSSPFGYRLHPIEGETLFHYGTDYASAEGTEITAFASGTVSVSGVSESMGKYLIIDHGDGWETRYFHCSRVIKTGGSTVEKGETVAETGATGAADGAHLHFELLHDGIYYDPELCLEAAE